MDVREKLVELLGKANLACVGTDCFEGCKFYMENNCLHKLMADVMIENGVTVQEWIPVTERLPEQADPATAVLGITKQGKCYVVYYYKAAINDEFTGFYDNAVKIAVTNWMPIPQPPKGE